MSPILGGLGTVVFNERRFDIERLELARGAFVATITVPAGPFDPGDGRYVVFAPDGTLVVQAALSDETLADVLRCRSDEDVWIFSLAIHMEGMMTNRVRARIEAHR